MPITIKSSLMQYRDSNGDYVGVDAVSERTTAEYLSAIEDKGETTLDSIPEDYTTLNNEVEDLKSALNNVGIDVLPLYKGKVSIVDGEYSYNTSNNYTMYLPDTYGLCVKAGDMIVVTPFENTTLSGYIIYANKVQLFSKKDYISGYVFQQDYDNIVINVGSSTSIANSNPNTGKITVYRISKTKYIDILKKKIAYLDDKQKLTNLFDGLYSNQQYDASTGDAGVNNSAKYVSGINPISVSSGDVITFADFPIVFKYIYVLYYGANGFISYKTIGYASGLPYSVTIPSGTTYFRFEISFENATDASEVPIIGIYKNSILGINGETSNIGLEMLGSSRIPNDRYISDLTFIGQYLCCFSSSNDAHTEYGPLEIMSVDFEHYALTSYKALFHNFGHCNTVDYCEETDTLILGNGGNSSNTEPNQIYIIKDATSSILGAEQSTNISLANVALVIDINDAGLDWGKQLNVCWAYANHGRHDLAFAISNSGNIQTIRLILLGRGQNELDYGTIIAAEDDEFNGTFSILNTWTRAYESSIANQGTQYYKGHLYEAYGHGKIAFDKMTLLNDGSTHSNFVTNPVFDGTGTEVWFDPEGCAIKDGVLFSGTMEVQSGSYPYELRKIGMFHI